MGLVTSPYHTGSNETGHCRFWVNINDFELEF